MARKKSRAVDGGRWIMQAVLAAVVVTGATAAAFHWRPLWDADHYKWKLELANGADQPRLELSIQPLKSTLGNEDGRLSPSLRINCQNHQLNLYLAPMRSCTTICMQDFDVDFDEAFLDDAGAPQGPSSHGHWRIPPQTESAARFNYADATTASQAYPLNMAARAFIERLANSKSFVLTSQGGEVRYDTGDLAAKLPKLWAVCPAPAEPPPAVVTPPQFLYFQR